MKNRCADRDVCLQSPGSTDNTEALQARIDKLNNETMLLVQKHQTTNDIEDINKAIRLLHQTVLIFGSPGDERILGNLAGAVATRYESTGAIDDLDIAVSAMKRVIAGIGPGHPNAANCFSNLASILHRKFERTGTMEDLSNAIGASIQVTEVMSAKHPQASSHLEMLSRLFSERAKRTKNVNDWRNVITALTRAVHLTAPGGKDYYSRLIRLGAAHHAQHEKTGAKHDLDGEIDALTKAVKALPESHPVHALTVASLSSALILRFEAEGNLHDINDSIDFAKVAAASAPTESQNHEDILHLLGTALLLRTRAMGKIDDLDQVFESVGSVSNESRTSAKMLHLLARCYRSRFTSTGAVQDINKSVDLASKAADSSPPASTIRVDYIKDLGDCLRLRFERLGSLDDINRAIDIMYKEAQSIPKDYKGASNYLNLMGICFARRFERTGTAKDLDLAIEAATFSSKSLDDNDPARVRPLGNLAGYLRMKYDGLRAVEDLDKAVDIATDAIRAMPASFKDKATWYNVLAMCLGHRYNDKGLEDDLTRAIDAATKAVDDTPNTSPDRVGRLVTLANCIGMRYEKGGVKEDRDYQLSLLNEGICCRSASPTNRILAAKSAALACISDNNWVEASRLFREGVLLLSKVTMRSSKQIDSQGLLGKFGTLASSAAAAALNAGQDPKDALQVLELGRGVIAGTVLDMHKDVSELEAKHPDLVCRFRELRAELERPRNNLLAPQPEDVPFSEIGEARRHEAEEQFDDLIEDIQSRPGFEGFLRPPAIDDFIKAAERGPIIIINMSPYRSDAFLVSRDGVKAISLPGLTPDELGKRVTDIMRKTNFASLLEWMWKTICCPCLDALSITGPGSDDKELPHVWWMPVGLVNQLPLHAAGVYGLKSRETVMDRVISSYALTFKALLHGRRQRSMAMAKDKSEVGAAVLVAMTETPDLEGGGALPYAEEEAQMLRNICPSLGIEAVSPSPKKEHVLSRLPGCSIFHFAGHGRTNGKEPSLSCILLEDWKHDPLAVGDLRDARLHEDPPFMAYLSACSTGADRWWRLPDEGINLVGAAHLAGFRHVVGTFWQVSDRHCVDVAKVLYETLRDEGLTDDAVALGLHRGVRALRDGKMHGGGDRDATLIRKGITVQPPQGISNPFWIPYFHFGV